MNQLLIHIDAGDRHFSSRIAQWCPPRWFRSWMLFSTRLGDGWLWAFLALFLLTVGDYRVLAVASAATSIANAVMIVLKRKCRRSRPRLVGTNHFMQLVRADLSAFDEFSFPSGHTMNAFAIGTVLSGKISGSAAFDGPGTSLAEMVAAASGSGSYNLANLSIAGFAPTVFAQAATVPDLIDVTPEDLTQTVTTQLAAGPFTAPAATRGSRAANRPCTPGPSGPGSTSRTACSTSRPTGSIA